MKKVAEEDRRLKALEEFETEEQPPGENPVNIFELYRPMINGESVRAKGIPSNEK